MTKPVALVTGAGAEHGLGAAVARAFAKGGHHVVVSGRSLDKVETVAAAIRDGGGAAEAVALDVTNEADVAAVFAEVERKFPGALDAVIYNAGDNRPAPFRETTAEHFEAFWRVGCFGGFLVGREAAKVLVPRGKGAILFTGASGSLRGKANYAAFAAAKAGLRATAQSMAREFGPQGVHVAHVIIDGVIDGARIRKAWPGALDRLGEDGMLDVDDIAANYWHLYSQPRSAWTQELDLRPFKEPW
ncbi:putative oxidoreductase [Alphaproteobacteria bacterium SO-S41]|nr:putative oxidoreductase [Alphaproteobacteria bacterium SO-S41]